MGKYLIVIHDIPPSNNQFIGKNKRWQYNKLKKYWQEQISNAITKKPAEPIKNAQVHIHYVFPNRIRRDPDNYSGKMINDPLVRNGILADDSFNNIKLVLSAEVDKTNPRTEILITDLGERNDTGNRRIFTRSICFFNKTPLQGLHAGNGALISQGSEKAQAGKE